MTECEQWRPWPRDPSVSVSNLGRVKSRFGRVLKPHRGKWCVGVGLSVNVKVKHLVWQAWVEDVDVAITHRDGDRTNCAVSNLVAHDHAAFNAVQQDALSKLDADDASRCVELYRQGKSAREIAGVFGVSGVCVHNTIKRTGVTPKDIRRERKARDKSKADAAADECIAVWNEGLSVEAVAERLSLSAVSVYQRLKRAGVSVRKMKAERKDAHDAAWARTLGIPEAQVDVKRRYLLKTYGLSLDEYQALKEGQGHKCKCGDPFGPERTFENQTTIGGMFPVVDHCHGTDGKRHSVRAILHASCNTVVGMLREDREKFKKLGKHVDDTRHARPFRPAPHTPGLPGLTH